MIRNKDFGIKIFYSKKGKNIKKGGIYSYNCNKKI